VKASSLIHGNSDNNFCAKLTWEYVVNDRPVGKPQEKVLMKIATSFPSVMKPRFNRPGGG
jgi:hypothetical protein